MIFSCKWRNKGNQFVNYTSCTPNIGFFIILIFVYLFWTHIIWSSDIGTSKLHRIIFRLALNNSRETEITQFDIIIAIEKYVAWFKVSMKNFASFYTTIMTFSKSQQNLHEYFPNDVFGNKIFFSFAFFN